MEYYITFLFSAMPEFITGLSGLIARTCLGGIPPSPPSTPDKDQHLLLAYTPKFSLISRGKKRAICLHEFQAPPLAHSFGWYTTESILEGLLENGVEFTYSRMQKATGTNDEK